MKEQTLVFRVDQGGYHPVMCLKQLTVSDDSKLLQDLFDFADKEGEEKEVGSYQAKVQFLSSIARPFPASVEVNGKRVKRPDGALDSAESIQAFFADYDPDKDWIAEFALRSMREYCQPTVSFFTVSKQ